MGVVDCVVIPHCTSLSPSNSKCPPPPNSMCHLKFGSHFICFSQQLKCHMKEIESTRKQIQPSDLPKFDERIKPIQDELQAGVDKFREVQKMYTHEKLNKEPKRMPFAKNRDSGNADK